MDFLDALVLGYSAFVIAMLAVALNLRFAGKRGKFYRALLISIAAGIIVPFAAYYSYPYLFPPPIFSPLPPFDPHTPLLARLFIGFTESLPALGQGIGYNIDRMVDPFVAGVVAILIAFSLSFLIPNSGHTKNAKQVFQTAT